MTKLRTGGLVAIALLAVIVSLSQMLGAAEGSTMNDWGPQWTAKGELILPKGYHEWVFVGSPITPHGLNGGKAGFPEYHNVYVHPKVFKAYRTTGKWPEGTIMLKELQLSQPGTFPDGSSVEVSGRGYFPAARNGIDISVKDSKRFKDTNGWGFFNFGHHAPPYVKTARVAPTESCASCHASNAGKGMVFRQYYPILQ